MWARSELYFCPTVYLLVIIYMTAEAQLKTKKKKKVIIYDTE